MKNIFSFLKPYSEEKIKSPINGEIIIRKSESSTNLLVQGYIQSGKYSEGLLEFLLSKITYKKRKIKKILILGVGGGTMVKLLREKFKNASIVGVELDPEMIEAGRKYFGLGEIKNLALYVDDAAEFIKRKFPNKFDLIVMDLFIGCDTPTVFDHLEFLENVKKNLSSNGYFFINRSYLQRYRLETDFFVKNLKRIFSNVETYHLKPNLLIIAGKESLKIYNNS